MRSLLSVVLGAAVLSGSISYHIATTHFEIVTSLSEWFLNRSSFTALYYLASAFVGIIFITAGRRGSAIDKLVQSYGSAIAGFYASAGGSVMGWVGGVCLAALLDSPGSYWSVVIYLFLMATFVAVIPLFAIRLMSQVVSKFNNRWFRQRSREPYINIIGVVLLISSLIMLIYELVN